MGLGLQLIPPSSLLQIPGTDIGAEAALGMSMAYMVLPSEAIVMTLISQGERRSFLLLILPGVSTMAHLSIAVSGAWASASLGDGVRVDNSRTAITDIQQKYVVRGFSLANLDQTAPECLTAL